MFIVDKLTGDTYTAAEFTQFKNEAQNFILSSGQVLTSNSVQTKQAAVRYVANASAYTEAGVADAYILNVIANAIGQPNDFPTAYLDQMVARFIAGNNNTGISTVNVTGLGVKTIKKNGFADDLAADDIVAGKTYAIIFSLSADLFELIKLSDAGSGAGAGGGISAIIEETVDRTMIVDDFTKLIKYTEATAADRTYDLLTIVANEVSEVNVKNRSDFNITVAALKKVSDAAEAGSTDTTINATAHGGVAGQVCRFTSGVLDGELRRITSVNVNDFTVSPAFTTNPAIADTFTISDAIDGTDEKILGSNEEFRLIVASTEWNII